MLSGYNYSCRNIGINCFEAKSCFKIFEGDSKITIIAGYNITLKGKTSILLLLLLTVKTGYIHGQFSVTMDYRQTSANTMAAVPIVVNDPVGNIYSTADLSRQFPDSKIPVETIAVNFPNMSGAIDTASILWYLKPENYSPKGEVNIVIVTISADSVKTFYIDNNNDRTFSDNEEKFIFTSDVEKRDVQILISGNSYKYTLMNPDYVRPVSAPSRTGHYSQVWSKASRRPSLNFDFSIITGGGDATVSYVPVEGFFESYEYIANIVGSIKPTIGLDFSWFNFHVMLFGAFERLQYDETILYGYSQNIKGGKQRYYERGSWPTSKLHWGVTAEYDIRIKKVYFTPFATYSRFDNIQEKKFDKAVTISPDAAYRDMFTREAGAKLKVPVGEKTLIYLKYTYSQSWFDITDYIYAYEEGTYEVDYKQNFFGMGVQYRLFK